MKSKGKTLKVIKQIVSAPFILLQILPNLHLPTQAADLPFYSDMLSIHPGGISQIWTDKRILAGAQTHSSLSPMGR